MALTKEGTLTWCVAPPEKIGQGRCNHVAHINDGETVKEFIERCGHPQDTVGIAKTNPAIEKEHNQQAYREAKEVLEREGVVAIVQATGTGKSSVIGAIIDDYKHEKIVFLSPSNDINNAMKGYASTYGGKDAKYLTYSLLMMKYKKGELHEFEDTGLIVADELHRLGANKWGEAFEALRRAAPRAKVVGATATPVRSDGRNMVNEYFNGNSVSNLSLERCIEKGILKTPRYVSLVWMDEQNRNPLEEELSNVKGMSTKRLREKLNQAIRKYEEENQVHQILRNNLSEIEAKNAADGKGMNILVFCSDENDIERKAYQIQEEYQKAFPNKRIILGKYTSKTTDHDFKDFSQGSSKEEIKLLFTVNKLNEGVHLKQLDSIMMMRKTGSDIVYKQQLGRALSIGSEQRPLIMDFASNHESNEYKEMWQRIEQKTGQKILTDHTEELSKTIREVRVELHRHNGVQVHEYKGYVGSIDEIIKRFNIPNSDEVRRMVQKEKSPLQYAIIKASGQVPYIRLGKNGVAMTLEELCESEGVSLNDVLKITGKNPNNKQVNDAIDQLQGKTKKNTRRSIMFY